MFGGLAIHNDQLFVSHGFGRGTVTAFDPRTLERKLEFEVRDSKRRRCVAGGIGVGPTYSIHVADPFGRAVRVFSIFGKALARIGVPVDGDLPVAPDRRGLLAEPCAVVVDDRGHVYVASAGGPRLHAVQRFTAEGRFLGSYRAFGVAGEAFNSARALALSKQHLFVADAGNGAVHVFQRGGAFRQVFSTATRHGERSFPVSLALCGVDGLLVLDRGDTHALRRFTRAGNFVGDALAGVPIDAPIAVAAGERGEIALLDLDGERLRAFTPDGSLVKTIGLDSGEPESDASRPALQNDAPEVHFGESQ